MDQVQKNKHKRSDEKEHDHSGRKRVKHKHHTKKLGKKEERPHVAADDPNEDMWVEKNVDMNGEKVCVHSSLVK